MPTALVVEDEYEPEQLVRRVLQHAGFDQIHVARSRSSALDLFKDTLEDIDLYVLDRNIPEHDNGAPSQAIGDLLLSELRPQARDRPFVVFTAWDDSDLYQVARIGSGQIVVTDSSGLIEDVFVLNKLQTLDLGRRASAYTQLLGELDRIEVEGLGESPPWLFRLMRKVAIQAGGVRILCRPLSGGRSGARVWHCTVFDSAGNVLANRVAKETVNLASLGASSFVGVHSSVAAGLVASFVGQVQGACGGHALDLFQSAGPNSQPIDSLFDTREDRAVELVSRVVAGLTGGHQTSARSAEFRETVEVFDTWDDFSTRLASAVSTTPIAADLPIWGRYEPQHGDLHLGNVLVDGDTVALIDFDRQQIALRGVDPATALLAMFLHPDGAFFEDVAVTEHQLIELIDGRVPESLRLRSVIQVLVDWLAAEVPEQRARWAVVLGYAVRQLRWRTEVSDPITVRRIQAISVHAVEMLHH